ncbi:hypothetical protein GCM10017687_59790 [Streptomyces echinatus]
MIAAWSKGRLSGMGTTVSSGVTMYSAQPAVVVDAGGADLGAGAMAHTALALAARLARLQGDAGADGQVPLEVGAEGVDDTGDLVADGDRVGVQEERRQGAVEEVDVGQADACGLHLDEDLTRSGYGDGDLLHGELLAVHVEASGEHGVHEELLSVSGTDHGDSAVP